MSTVTLALAGLATALATIDPSPQPVPANIFVWTEDYDPFDYTVFPFIIVSQVVNRWFDFSDTAHSLVSHSWIAEVDICLAKGPLTRMEAAKEAEAKQVPWLNALNLVLSANRSLGGTAQAIGADGKLFRYRIGEVSWDNSQVFWGIKAEIPVIQQLSAPAS